MKILFVQKVKALVGSEKYFLELIPELENRGIDIEFVCIYNRIDKEKTIPFIEAAKQLNITIHILETHSDRSVVKVLRFIKTVFKKSRFDLVHSHLIHADLWVTLLKRTGTIKCPIVSTKHGYDEAYISKHGFDGKNVPGNLYFKLCKFSEKKIKRSFAVSDGLKQLFIDSGISRPDAIETIHHGFDFPATNSMKEGEFRLAKNQLVIVGRIIPFKGHELLIESLISIKDELKDFKLIVLGHGDEDLIEKLKNTVHSHGLENLVEFLGYRSNVNDYLQNSDIMVVPSIAEGFGLVFLEAMNNNIPIIGFDVPATNEVVKHNETGFLVPSYDTQVMGKTIVDLINSPTERERLSKNAKERLVSYFCLDRMVTETISFYKKTLN